MCGRSGCAKAPRRNSWKCNGRTLLRTCQTTRILKCDSGTAEALVVGRGFGAEQVRALLVVGAVPIDNNIGEREMKRVALNRENSLFVGNPRCELTNWRSSNLVLATLVGASEDASALPKQKEMARNVPL